MFFHAVSQKSNVSKFWLNPRKHSVDKTIPASTLDPLMVSCANVLQLKAELHSLELLINNLLQRQSELRSWLTIFEPIASWPPVTENGMPPCRIPSPISDPSPSWGLSIKSQGKLMSY